MEIISVTQTSLEVLWARSDEMMPNLVFYARTEIVGKQNNQNFTATENICSRLTSCEIKSLQSGVLYKVSLYGENDIGKGEETSIFVHTKGKTNTSKKIVW